MSEVSAAATFPTTRWTRVARAGDPGGPEAREALEGLCRDYWYPLYALGRREGLDREEAGDLVQGFLADLIARQALATADPARGRFRSFLRSGFLHHLAHRRDHDRAQKRGGGAKLLSIDLLDAEGRNNREPAHDLTAERLFERRWALELLGHVLDRLGREAGRPELFDRLRPMLEGDDRPESCREIGAALGMTEGAVRVAAHRLRRRYRDLLREEVARTVADPADVDDELAELLAALS